MKNNQNSTNVLKKTWITNPYVNLGLPPVAKLYDNCKTDEDLADFYHQTLNYYDSKVLFSETLKLIGYSTGEDVNFQLFNYAKSICND